MAYMLREAPAVPERRLDLPADKVIVDRDDVPAAPVRWSRRHPAITVALVVLAWLLTIAVAFEVGHAYAEGVRSVGALGDHLSGGRFGSMHAVAKLDAWLWN